MKKFILPLLLVMGSFNAHAAPGAKLRILSTTWCGWCHVVAKALTEAKYLRKTDNEALLTGEITVKVKGKDTVVAVEEVVIDHKDFSKVTLQQPALDSNAEFYPYFQLYVGEKKVFTGSRSKMGTSETKPDCSTAEGIKTRLEMELNK